MYLIPPKEAWVWGHWTLSSAAKTRRQSRWYNGSRDSEDPGVPVPWRSNNFEDTIRVLKEDTKRLIDTIEAKIAVYRTDIDLSAYARKLQALREARSQEMILLLAKEPGAAIDDQTYRVDLNMQTPYGHRVRKEIAATPPGVTDKVVASMAWLIAKEQGSIQSIYNHRMIVLTRVTAPRMKEYLSVNIFENANIEDTIFIVQIDGGETTHNCTYKAANMPRPHNFQVTTNDGHILMLPKKVRRDVPITQTGRTEIVIAFVKEDSQGVFEDLEDHRQYDDGLQVNLKTLKVTKRARAGPREELRIGADVREVIGGLPGQKDKEQLERSVEAACLTEEDLDTGPSKDNEEKFSRN